MKHYLSVATIIKDESKYLDEWLNFHLLQGIQHFYLYDNNSTDNTKAVLEKYQKVKNKRKSIITLIDWPEEPGQPTAMTHALKNCDSEWVAFIDADEFLHATRGTFVEHLYRLDRGYDCSAIAVHWLNFGTNGHIQYSPELVMERFTRRENKVNDHCKSIVRIKDAIERGEDVHHFHVKGQIIDEAGRILPKDYSLTRGSADTLRINHYVTKSREEAAWRYARPRADTGQARNFDIHFPAHDRNEIEDLTLMRWVDLVKKSMMTWR